MKITLRFSLPLIILTLTIIASHSAGKVTQDPNIAQSTIVTSAKDTDERLAQKITCDAGYARLHDVVTQLDEKSGVKLHSGTNAEDWPVRDIPLVVYAKDITLGKLLRAVSDGAHTQFSVEKVANAGKDQLPSYRIHRTQKVAADIVNLIDARHAAQLAEAVWGWDTLVEFGKSSIEDPNVPREAALLAKILASANSKLRDSVLKGEEVVLSADKTARPELMRELYALGYKKMRYDRGQQKEPQPDDVKQSELKIFLQDGGESGYTGLFAECFYNIGPKDTPEWMGSYWIEKLDAEAGKLKSAKGFQMPSRPKVPEIPKPEDECPSDRLRILKSDEDWSIPALQIKINLEAPKDKEHPTFSDEVIAIAGASGYNVVCEDFESHQNSAYEYGNGDPGFDKRVDGFFVKDITLGNALKKLADSYKQVWFINEEDKLIVGWASGWRFHHRNLVRGNMLDSLRAKMNGSGAELDDIVQLVNLTYEQTNEWIRRSHEFYEIAWFNSYSDDVSAWRLYDALSKDDKVMAKSEAGIQLAKFDPNWVCSFFTYRTKVTPRRFDSDTEVSQKRTDENTKNLFFANPDSVSKLTMRVAPGGQFNNYVLVDKNGVEIKPESLIPVLRLYHLEIKGDINGSKTTLKIPGPDYPLPLMNAETKKRQKEGIQKLFEQGYTIKRKSGS